MKNKPFIVGVSLLLILAVSFIIFKKYRTENINTIANNKIDLNDPCSQLDENSCYLNDSCVAKIQCGKTKDGQEICIHEYKGCRAISAEEQTKQNTHRDLCVSTNGNWERNSSNVFGYCNCKPTADGKTQGFAERGCAVY